MKNTAQNPENEFTVVDSFEIRQVQVAFSQTYRQLFVFNHGLADHDINNQTKPILKVYELLTITNKHQSLKIWCENGIVNFEQMNEGDVPTVCPQPPTPPTPGCYPRPVTYTFSGTAGSLFLGYKTDGTNVTKSYLIVGTGDFRNLNESRLDYLILPTLDDKPVVIECATDFVLNIYTAQPFL